jgi:DNA-binding NarL/FixJ family response regulator
LGIAEKASYVIIMVTMYTDWPERGEPVESSRIRVLVVEDDAIQLAGIRDYLLRQGMDVSEASNTADALPLVEEWAPDVVVLDIAIPPRHGEEVDIRDMEGIRLAQRIKEQDPQIGIVLCSNYPYHRTEVLDLVGHKGYKGFVYLFKAGTPPRGYRDAIHQAKKGSLILDPVVSEGTTYGPDVISRLLTEEEREKVEYAVSQMDLLTEGEEKVVELVAESRTTKGIAEKLCISTNTVDTHLRKTYQKLGLTEGEIGDLLQQRLLLVKAYIIYRSRRVRQRR